MTRRFLSLVTASRGALGITLALSQACAPHEDETAFSAESVPEVESVAQAVSAPPLTVVSPAAITVAAGAGFTYVEIAGAKCRDDSNAGVTVKRSSNPNNKNLLFYLQGGGACFDTQTCYDNPANIPESHRVPQDSGIFSTNNGTNNPFYDWNIVYVPYCTGDFHMGSNIASVDLGPSNQKFWGRPNLNLILATAKATFPGMTKVVLAGSSAGGGGAVASAKPVKQTFGLDKIFLLDDAGPFLSSGSTRATDYLPVDEQTRWRSYWNLDATILADCGAPCANQPNFMTAFAKNTINVIGRKAALVVGKQDMNVIALYGSARADQYGPAGYANLDLQSALNDFRTNMAGTWSTYYVTAPMIDAQRHMRLVYDNFYGTHMPAINGSGEVYLTSWVWNYINGYTTLDVGY